MATVPPTRLAPSPLAPRIGPLASGLLARIAQYTILVSIVHPMVGIGLAVATLRTENDATIRRRARIAIVVGVLAYLLYALAMIAMVRVCFDLIARLVALST